MHWFLQKRFSSVDAKKTKLMLRKQSLPLLSRATLVLRCGLRNMSFQSFWAKKFFSDFPNFQSRKIAFRTLLPNFQSRKIAFRTLLTDSMTCDHVTVPLHQRPWLRIVLPSQDIAVRLATVVRKFSKWKKFQSFFKNYISACFMWFQSFWAKNFFFQIFQISNRGKSPFVLCFQISNRGKSPFVLCFQIPNRGKSPFVLCLRIPWHAIMLPFHCIRDRDYESCCRHRTSRLD